MVELIRITDPARAAELSQLEAAVCDYPWHSVLYEQSLQSEREQVQLLERDGACLAVLVSEVIIDELHIHNVFVPLPAQRQGHARAILQAALAQAAAAGCVRALLEVRVGNLAAIALYQALGFVRSGVRRAYYPAAGAREDALLMERTLP